ncbi:MAG: type II toxin-antitoxin system RelE/ParE family toxin [Proteobacteria bacterium]|nr:type II toxin-antitoxin system RelE/ParE family toxin [Pseudomonadota bacterium]
MQIFKTKWFARFARKEHINDEMLMNAIREIERGLADGELGAELIKKRIARIGEGKRGGYRTIIAYRVESLSVFLYGFPKNAKSNLSPVELDVYHRLAHIYLGFSNEDFTKAQQDGEVEEVHP